MHTVFDLEDRKNTQQQSIYCGRSGKHAIRYRS